MSAQQHARQSPFLSVVVPVGAVGEQALRETLLCLMGQEDDDFEVLLALPAGQDATATERVLTDQPPSLCSRVHLVRTAVEGPGEVRNVAVAEARGRYVTVLPEGDLVLGSWVRTFRSAEPATEHRVLRALSVTQDHAVVDVGGRAAIRAEGSPRSQSPAAFSLWQHAVEPLSPPGSWAWPRELADSGVGYDEHVVDDPDWELLVRLGELVGVAVEPVVTSVHREWTMVRRNALPEGPTAQQVIDARPLVIPAGEAARLRAENTQTAIVRRLNEKLDLKREQLQLTHDHASNLEGIVRHLEEAVRQLKDRAAHLEQRHAKAERRHAKEVARLRRKLESARAARPADAADPAEAPAPKGSWRLRGRGSGD